MHIRRLALIGVGLIGGSLTGALRRTGAVDQVVGFDTVTQELVDALRLGLIDLAASDVHSAVKQADLVVVAVPLGAVSSVFQAVASGLGPDTVITDVGSAKVQVMAHARAALGSAYTRYVPAHPIAGTELSGANAAQTDLFQHRKVILTPNSETVSTAVKLVEQMWEAAGAVVQHMDAQRHDDVLAATSHLPHVLAFALVHSLARSDPSGAIFDLVGSGFTDSTRIASSRPEVWRDIALDNADAILAAIKRFEDDLQHFTTAIATRDGATLQTLFEEAKTARDEFVVGRQGHCLRSMANSKP